jgi:hypothetical protein
VLVGRKERGGGEKRGERGIPGRVLERELAVAEPEKSGGKLEDEIGGTRGEEGAEMGGEDMFDDVICAGWMPSLWERGEWVWREGGGEEWEWWREWWEWEEEEVRGWWEGWEVKMWERSAVWERSGEGGDMCDDDPDDSAKHIKIIFPLSSLYPPSLPLLLPSLPLT